MATGDVAKQNGTHLEEGDGVAVLPTGRVSIARSVKPHKPVLPFSSSQLASLDEALTIASRSTGIDFSIYLGELGENTRTKAEQLHAGVGHRASDTVIIAVSPGQRVVEVVTGEESGRRIADRGCKLAVMSMVASFKEGDLAGGLLSGLRMLADQAGAHH
ncbi:DUF5130 family protein [Pseudonocardiaceae bacterium YIM PH 21723]|nr:DUF5130 family protein [Pseudonocardiaceae bacterium YIM PH 21723]